ncbi:MAG: hypothetical protein ABJA98_06560 [Acidobacteriota bacterium]
MKPFTPSWSHGCRRRLPQRGRRLPLARRAYRLDRNRGGAAVFAATLVGRWHRVNRPPTSLAFDMRRQLRRVDVSRRWSLSIVVHHDSRVVPGQHLLLTAAQIRAAVHEPVAGYLDRQSMPRKREHAASGGPRFMPGAARAIVGPPAGLRHAGAVIVRATSLHTAEPRPQVPPRLLSSMRTSGASAVVDGRALVRTSRVFGEMGHARAGGPESSRAIPIGRPASVAPGAPAPRSRPSATARVPFDPGLKRSLVVRPADRQRVVFRDAPTTAVRPPMGGRQIGYDRVLAGASRAIVRRTSRVEHRPQPIALKESRAGSVPIASSDRRLEVATTPRRPAVSNQPRTIPEASLAEVERSITAKLEQRLDQKITATIKAKLASDVDLSHTMTDRVYDALYDRLILEKERLA